MAGNEPLVMIVAFGLFCNDFKYIHCVSESDYLYRDIQRWEVLELNARVGSGA